MAILPNLSISGGAVLSRVQRIPGHGQIFAAVGGQ